MPPGERRTLYSIYFFLLLLTSSLFLSFSLFRVLFRDSVILAAQLVDVLSRAEETAFNSAVAAQVKQRFQSGLAVVQRHEYVK